MKIGILGGTFNPVHNAHIYLARECFENLKLDRLILIPTFIPPHKSAECVVSAKCRLEMCGLAVKPHPEFEVCDFEISEKGKSYTYRTLKHLRGVYPDGKFFLIMGADMFLTVQDWRRPEEIYKMATLCAAAREYGGSHELENHAALLRERGADCIILRTEVMPISSTEVRERIEEGGDVTGLLDPAVWDYIREQKLYGA